MRGCRVIGSASLLTLLAACGSGSSGNSETIPVPGPPPFTSVPQVQVSQPSTFGACNGVAQPGTLYHNTAVEPFLAVDPTNNAHLIAVFQKDRWSNGGSQAQNLAVSFDGGGNFSYTTALPLDGSADGGHDVVFVAADRAGNTTRSATESFTLDTRPPSIGSVRSARRATGCPTCQTRS